MATEDGLAPASINRTITQLVQRVLNFAKSPNPELSSLLFAEEERVRELTYDEEGRLYAAIRQDYIPFLAFSLETGIRKFRPNESDVEPGRPRCGGYPGNSKGSAVKALSHSNYISHSGYSRSLQSFPDKNRVHL